jgi:hypothetical protein
MDAVNFAMSLNEASRQSETADDRFAVLEVKAPKPRAYTGPILEAT